MLPLCLRPHLSDVPAERADLPSEKEDQESDVPREAQGVPEAVKKRSRGKPDQRRDDDIRERGPRLQDDHGERRHKGRERRVAERISLLLAAEATRDMPVAGVTVQTPLGPAPGRSIETPVVVVPVLRAGLGMLDAMLKLIPTARVGPTPAPTRRRCRVTR